MKKLANLKGVKKLTKGLQISIHGGRMNICDPIFEENCGFYCAPIGECHIPSC